MTGIVRKKHRLQGECGKRTNTVCKRLGPWTVVAVEEHRVEVVPLLEVVAALHQEEAELRHTYSVPANDPGQ